VSEYENFLSEFEKLSFKMPNFRGYGPLLAFTGGGAALGAASAPFSKDWKKLNDEQKGERIGRRLTTGAGLGLLLTPSPTYRVPPFNRGSRARQARGGYEGYQRRHGASNRSAAKDAMNTLNIGSNVKTKKEAQKLYRKQAMKYHPDRGGDPAKMSEVNKAWETFQNSSHFQKLAFHEELQKIANLAGGGYFGSTPMARPGAMSPMNTARMANQGAAKIVQPRKPRMAAQKGISAKAQQASASALAQASNLQPQKFASAKPKKVAKGKHWLYHKKKREVEEAPVSRGRDDEAATSEEEGKPEDNEGVRYDSNAHLAKQSSVRSGRSTELLKIARGAHRANPILNLRKHHKNKKPSDVLRAMANKSRK
tara:strand:- start:5832 stop:6932 length:1101 start_codon:yes stop_codon:yes gene_type:complete